MWAVVGFVAGIANALDRFAATRARLLAFAVNGHFFAERSHLLRKRTSRFFAQPRNPRAQGASNGLVKPHDLFRFEFLRQLHRRELGLPEDFVRIGIADSTEQVRIGKSS